MTVYVDPRIGSSHLMVGLQEQQVPCELTHLDFGDCCFFGNGPDDTQVSIGVELKNVADLVQSMQSGRLAGHQVPGLVEAYGHVWLIVEGFYRASRRTGQVEVPRGKGWQPLGHGRAPIFWRALENFLTTLEVQAGLHIRRTRTSNETARFIALLYHWWTDKAYAEHTSLHVMHRPHQMQLVSDNEATHRLRQVAACLPAIGWARSKAVAAKFRSIDALIGSTAEDWTSIEGIGHGIATDIMKALYATGRPADEPAAVAPSRRVPQRRGAAARSVRHSRRH
jgi:ERCC4-type nuclease